LLTKTDHKTAVKKYIKAAIKGVVKTMAKMGISTIQSYRGAQIFEAVGLNSEVVNKYFTWTPSRIQGVGLDVIAEEALARHRHAFPDRQVNGVLDAGGQYQWRDGGEYHSVQSADDPQIAERLPHGQLQNFQEYAELINNQAKNLCTLRGLLDFKFAEESDSD
jgi:glutamate synthase (NADPH) large chain